MEQELLSLLADTQSARADTRKAAELQLKSLYSNESFPISLTAIASHESVPVNLRQSSLSVLRTFIAASWSPVLDEFKGQILVNDANKAQIRRALLELATTTETPERKVKASASYAVSKIASADFPDDWPELLPSLLHIINDSATTDNALHPSRTIWYGPQGFTRALLPMIFASLTAVAATRQGYDPPRGDLHCISGTRRKPTLCRAYEMSSKNHDYQSIFPSVSTLCHRHR